MPSKLQLGLAAGALAAIAGAFVAGRFSAPLQVKTVDVEKVVYKDRVVTVEKRVEVAAKAETKVVYRERVTAPDGTKTERETEKTETKEDTKTNVDTSQVATKEVQTVKYVETTTTLRPDWRVAVLAGASLHDPALKVAGPLVLGAEIDRRLLGGLSAGLWVNTVGACGVAVSFEF